MISKKRHVFIDPSGLNIVNTVSYDLLGNKLSATDGEGKTTSYAYDNGSRLTTVTQTVGGTPLTTSYTYDMQEGGYIKNSVTDANGHVTQAWFDQMGNKVNDYNYGQVESTTANDTTFTHSDYTYNLNNQMEIVTRPDQTVVKYDYNELGQVEAVYYFGPNPSDSDVRNNNTNTYITYEYDINGKKVKETACDRGGEVQTTTYVYDSIGRVIQTGQGTATVTYTYNGADKVTMVSYTKDGTVRKLGYVYDGYGRIERITVQLGGGSAQTVRQYVYKANGDLDYTREYREFDTAGQGYIDTAYTLNGAGMTTNITSTNYQNSGATGVVKESCAMQYDRRGYITSETNTTNYGSSSTTSKSYTYDEIGRLTQAAIGVKTNAYTYDSVGNRLTKNDGFSTQTYHYNEFNQLTSITGGKYETYTYDGRGNQTGKGMDIYAYNLMDQLTRADVHKWEDPDGHGYDKIYSEVNTYNAAGQRVKMTPLEDGIDYGATTRYYYTGSSLLYTTNTDNNVLTESILDLNGGIVASKRFIDESGGYSEKYYFYHTDIRGSTTNIVKPDGSRVTGYTYDEFGNLESQNGSTKFLNEVTFTGSVYSKTTGLQYMNARFYSPSTGRFLSQDSYTGNPYDPWTQHLYSYCGNNPTNFIDPTGHFPQGTGGSGTLAKKGDRYISSIGPKGTKWAIVDFNYTDGRNVGSKGETRPSKKYTEFIDITEQLTNVLHNNKNIVEQKNGNTEELRLSNPALAVSTTVEDIRWFINQVKQDAVWDYKESDRFEAAFPKVKYFGTDFKGYLFNGEEICTTDIGNINFGYTGSALGFSRDFLLVGAGTFQLKDHDPKYQKNLLGALWEAINLGEVGYYGDEQDDFFKTNNGIDLFRSKY